MKSSVNSKSSSFITIFKPPPLPSPHSPHHHTTSLFYILFLYLFLISIVSSAPSLSQSANNFNNKTLYKLNSSSTISHSSSSNSNSNNNKNIYSFLNNNDINNIDLYSSINSKNINNNENYDNFYQSKEYIVMFNKYIDQKEHFSILDSLLTDYKDSKEFKWKLIDRNNAASNFPSDFALISLTSSSIQLFNNVLDKIISHSTLVKYVLPERRIYNSLRSIDELNNTEVVKEEVKEEVNEVVKEEVKEEEELFYIESTTATFKPLIGRHQCEIPDIHMENSGTIEQFLQQQFQQQDQQQMESRQLHEKSDEIQPDHHLHARHLWDKGITGSGVKVAVFDTGLNKKHPHFRNVKEAIDYTNEMNADDTNGHGTFVAGIIASQYVGCPGLAPEADLYIFRVFNSEKISFTSWFLDAFNHAIHMGIDVLNLSIGGHDFMDRPFVDKINEMSSNNIIIVSAIGNDGPSYGTPSNPADQSDVIGVGSIDSFDMITEFSSRGMTTWELPEGYGRFKPDIVTFGKSVLSTVGLKWGDNKCSKLSGSSVSSPIVAGAIALLISSVPDEQRHMINPASMKQILMESADRIDSANIFEQGHGKLNLLDAYETLQSYLPKASFSPSSIDFTECPYFWPYCTQPLYYSGIPTIVNVTIINGMDVTGQIAEPPTWIPKGDNGNNLHVSLTYNTHLWPWTGYLAVHLSVVSAASNFEGIAEGIIQVNISSPPSTPMKHAENQPKFHIINLPVRVKIIPRPPRQKRIIWDQYHNLRYPFGYLPKDALDLDEPFDLNVDHPHTNYRTLFERLRKAGYFIEILNSPLTCFNPKLYGALLIVDPEEEFFPSEIKKIEEDVRNNGLNLIVFADWYSNAIMDKMKFNNSNNSEKENIPITGGSNIPALNDLLSNFGIYLGDSVYNGDFHVGNNIATYSSGTSIIGFPKGGRLLYSSLSNIISNSWPTKVPILGFHQTISMNDELPSASSSSSGSGDTNENSGMVVVFGDSTCIDDSALATFKKQKKPNQQPPKHDCYWLFDMILEVTMERKDVDKTFPSLNWIQAHLLPYDNYALTKWNVPKRPTDQSGMAKISKVMHTTIEQKVNLCKSHIHHQLEADRFQWESNDKYHHIPWLNRSHVLPSEYPTYPPNYNSNNINPHYFYPYILMILAVIILLAHFFRKKPTSTSSTSSSTTSTSSTTTSSSSTTSSSPFRYNRSQIRNSNQNHSNSRLYGNSNGNISYTSNNISFEVATV